MSFFTIFALIVLPILGGFIAWAGDIIGYRLGKSRRSLLGLRPRSTARLVAVVVGVALPLATMLVAAAGSVEVRTALLHLTELQDRGKQLASENTALTQSLTTSRQQKDTAVKEAAEAQHRASEARASLATAQAALKGAQATLAATQVKLRAAADLRQQLDAEVRQLGGQVTQLQGTLTRTKSQLNVTARRLVATAKSLADTQKQKEALDGVVSGLRDTQEKLRLEVQNAQRDLTEAQRHLQAADDELAAKKEQLGVLQQQLEVAGGTAVYEAAQGIATGATGAVRYEPGTELMRTTVDTGQTQAQIEATLHELELVASRKPEGLGVRAPEGGLAVRLITPVPPGTTARELPNEDDLISLVAQEIRGSGAPQCVAVITVSLRSFYGDDPKRPVAADLSFRRNTLVYPRGAVIVHRVIDGSQPRAQVFEELWGVHGGLLGDLRAASQEAGLMRDPQSGQYGEVPAEELLRALDALVASKQAQEVEAVATHDVWVANEPPFVVTLKVGPQGGE